MQKVVTSAARTVRARRFRPLPVESFESRTMLSVSMNSAGFTVVTPPAGTRVIYVSSSGGNDGNSGLSASSPVKTIARGESLLQNGTGDQLLLKSGDIFYNNFIFWTLSGQSASNPMVIGSYGTGGARPEIMTGSQDGLETGKVSTPTVNYLDILGINFHANGRDPNMTSKPDTGANPAGIEILTRSTGILIENCEFQYYDIGITLQNYLGPVSNVTVRRNTIIDSYSGNTHAQGIYATGVTNLTIDGNFFDQDGYNAQLGIGPTVFNQECYLAYDDVNCVVENNIFSRAASAGLEDRPGGIVQDNTFIDDPIGMTFGLVNGALTTKGGVTGVITGNVFMGGGNIGNLAAGQAIQIGNIKAAGAVITDNIFTQGGAGGAPAITLESGKSQIDPQDSVGITNLTINGNIFNQWSTGIDLVTGLTPGGKGIYSLNDVTITGNEFEDMTAATIENHSASYASQEHVSGNSYYAAPHWLVNDAVVPDQGGTVMSHAFAFPNQAASVPNYDKALGDAGTLADFMARAATVSQTNWNTSYISQAVVTYFQESFGMKATTSVPPPTTTTPPPVTTTPPPTTTSTATAATATFTATKYTAQSNTHADGFGGVGTRGGAWLEYGNVNFGTGVSTFKVNVAALAKYAGTIQIRLDSPTGTEIGSMKVAGTGSWSKYVTQSASVKGATGVHNLYLVFVGGTAVGNVQSFTFTATAATTAAATLATSTINAVDYTAKSGAAADGYGGMGGSGGNWIEYGQINFGAGVSTFKASVAALAKYAGSYQLRLDSPTGTLVGTLKIAGTGAYNKYVTESTTVKGATGIHNLYLVFVGGGGVGNIKSFNFA